MHDHVLSPQACLSLQEYASDLKSKNMFKLASVGRRLQKKRAKAIRGDLIHWIEDWQVLPALAAYKVFVDELILFCRRVLFLQAKRFEGQLAWYPKGTYYRRHLDQHVGQRHRQLSCMLYFNSWEPGFGGELKIYPSQEEAVEISPMAGRFVCFRSMDLEHEVLKTNYDRLSLVGWIRDDIIVF